MMLKWDQGFSQQIVDSAVVLSPGICHPLTRFDRTRKA